MPPHTTTGFNLATGDVHVWRVTLNVPVDEAARAFAVLSPDEQEQARRFTFEAGRRRYTVARASLRQTLSRYTKTVPASHALGVGPHGKPHLKSEIESPSTNHDLRFNVSHTADLAVIAVAWQREVGIDIEQHNRAVEMENLAKRFFSAGEAKAVLRADASQRRHVFFRIWTTKEAYIKARGDGLSLPLDQFDVVTDLSQPPGLLATRHDPGDQAKWTFASVDAGEGFACTLAVAGPTPFTLQMFPSPEV